jgi:hypothetical protein
MRLSSFLLLAAFFTSACAAAPVDEEEGGETQSNNTVVLFDADLYVLDTPTMGADLEIRSFTKDGLLFSMEIGAKTPPNNTGQIGMQEDPFGKAKKNGNGSFTYTAGDCTLTFTGAPEAIKVVQDGACFGTGVDANGTFRRAAKKPAQGDYEIKTKEFAGTLTVGKVTSRTMKISFSGNTENDGPNAASAELDLTLDRKLTSWLHDSTGRSADGLGCFLEIKATTSGTLDVKQKDGCGFPMSFGVPITGIYKKAK